MAGPVMLCDLIDRLAERTPDAPALVDTSGNSTGWGDFLGRVMLTSARLAALGVGAGDRVAVSARNGPAFLELLFATVRTGALFMPLNWRLSAAELADQIDDSEPRVWFADAPFAATAAALASGTQVVAFDGARPDPLAGWREAGDPPAMPMGGPRDPDRPAGLFYTGGTTGRSKGVMLTHRNFLANARNVSGLLGYRPEDVHLHAAPMFHLADLGATVAQLAVGGAHCFLPAFDPKELLATVQRLRVTDMMLAPTMIDMVLDAMDAAAQPFDLRSWRGLLYGGSPITERTLRRAMDALPCDLYQGYGQSEATHTVCLMGPDLHRRAIGEPALLRTCGRVVDGVTIAVLDDDDRLLPAGAVGEVAVRGDTVMRGYWRRPGETEAALRSGWLHTGDLGALDEAGLLTLVDRKKDMIVSGAENVYSAEVETALSTHPAIAAIAVIPVPDARYGERVHAVIVPVDPSNPPQLDDIQAYGRKSLAGYKLPRSMSLAGELPKSAAGKIRKDVLKAPFWEGQVRSVS